MIVFLPLIMNSAPAAWTYMLYMAGDNNLAYYMKRTVSQLEALQYGPRVRVVVCIDTPDDCWIGEMGGQREWYGVADSGDPSMLHDFVAWAAEAAPAKHYYLAVMDHGRATSGICWDDSSNSHIDPFELREALEGSGVHLDVLHLDTCLMANIEIAYELRSCADYLVAYQGHGWSVFGQAEYVRLAQANPDISSRDLAVGVAQAYFDAPAIQGNARTVGVMELGKVGAVASTMTNMAFFLGIVNHGHTRDTCQKFDSRGSDGINEDDEYLDLSHLGELLGNQATMLAVDGELVIYEAHYSGYRKGPYTPCDDFTNAHGVSIYWPPDSMYSDYAQYGRFQFAQDTGWGEFLSGYIGVSRLGSVWEPLRPDMLEAR